MARAGEVLRLIRSGKATTTTQLAEVMSLARSTVSERIDLLVRNGLLVPDGEVTLGRGRPPVRYAFNAQAGYVLAVQLGMSGARIALTDLTARVLTSRTVDVDLSLGPQRVFDTVIEELDDDLRAVGSTREQLRGVGLGVPGRTELSSIRSRGEHQVRPWSDFDVAGHIKSALHVPVYVDQDVNLLALSEHRSSWPSTQVFVCVKVGTTIGCGIVLNDEVFRGGAGLSGEIAHTPVQGSTHQCDCGNIGCLNATASGAALVAQLRGQDGSSSLSTRDVAQRAAAGDVAAIHAIRQAGRHVGEVLAGVVNLLNPEVLAVWGYLDDAGEYLLTGVREAIYSGALPAASESLVITRATLGNDAGVQGAATAVIEQIMKPAAIDGWIHQAETLTQ
ncbi:ROK family transcriptional regulator [Ruania alba]|uniref:ROK family transcriptional regulator n=1 Tax=Ruania alba TaxID=648782 RepID=UPI000B7E62CC